MDDYKIAEMYLTLMNDEKSVSKNKTVSKNLKVNKTDSDSISQFTCGRSLAWTRTSALGLSIIFSSLIPFLTFLFCFIWNPN